MIKYDGFTDVFELVDNFEMSEIRWYLETILALNFARQRTFISTKTFFRALFSKGLHQFDSYQTFGMA